MKLIAACFFLMAVVLFSMSMIFQLFTVPGMGNMLAQVIGLLSLPFFLVGATLGVIAATERRAS